MQVLHVQLTNVEKIMLWYKQISCDSLYIRLHTVVGEGARANEISETQLCLCQKKSFPKRKIQYDRSLDEMKCNVRARSLGQLTQCVFFVSTKSSFRSFVALKKALKALGLT